MSSTNPLVRGSSSSPLREGRGAQVTGAASPPRRQAGGAGRVARSRAAAAAGGGGWEAGERRTLAAPPPSSWPPPRSAACPSPARAENRGSRWAAARACRPTAVRQAFGRQRREPLSSGPVCCAGAKERARAGERRAAARAVYRVPSGYSTSQRGSERTRTRACAHLTILGSSTCARGGWRGSISRTRLAFCFAPPCGRRRRARAAACRRARAPATWGDAGRAPRSCG